MTFQNSLIWRGKKREEKVNFCWMFMYTCSMFQELPPELELNNSPLPPPPPGGGGGGMSHWDLYIICINDSLKGTQNEDEVTYPQSCSLWTRHRACAPGPHRGITPKFPTLSADRQQTCPGDLWIWYHFPPFFHIFLFSIPLTRYASYTPGGEKDTSTLFTCFYLRRWCTGPNETFPPPPPRNNSFVLKMYVM